MSLAVYADSRVVRDFLVVNQTLTTVGSFVDNYLLITGATVSLYVTIMNVKFRIGQPLSSVLHVCSSFGQSIRLQVFDKEIEA
jgi:ABC-type uncharacterized transport system permease subunit